MRPYFLFSKTACSISALVLLTFSILPLKSNAFEISNSPMVPIDISADERKKIENMSCKEFVGTEIDKITAQTVKGWHSPTDVSIDCKPHNKLDGYPLRISVYCDTNSGKLSCYYPHLQALTTFSEQKIVVSSEPKEIHGAIEAVKYLDKAGKFTTSNFLKYAAEENICSISEFKNSIWSVSCNDGWWFELKRLCDGDKCNFELTGEGQTLH